MGTQFERADRALNEFCVLWITRRRPKSPADHMSARRMSSGSRRSECIGHKRQRGPGRAGRGTRHRRRVLPAITIAGEALDRQAGQHGPLIAYLKRLAHLVEKFSMRVVVAPAPATRKIGKVPLPPLDEREPPAHDTVVRTFLPFRHEAAKSAPLNRRLLIISVGKRFEQQKMNLWRE
jgi:hypothetical protein